MSTSTKRDAVALAFQHGIEPARCERTASHHVAGSGQGFDFHRDGSDTPVYQCRICGNMQSLSREAILRHVPTR